MAIAVHMAKCDNELILEWYMHAAFDTLRQRERQTEGDKDRREANAAEHKADRAQGTAVEWINTPSLHVVRHS